VTANTTPASATTPTTARTAATTAITASQAATSAATSEPAISGVIEMSQVANVIRTRTEVIRTCFQNQLARDPELRARVRVRFTIDAAGLVLNASSTAVAESGDPDRVGDLARCLEGIVRGTTFPARAGAAPAEVSMPFVFSPGAPSATITTAAAANAATSRARLTGHIDGERVRGTLRSRMGTLSQCYSRASALEPALAGRVTVRFVIEADGRVSEAQAQATNVSGSPTRMTEVTRCVQAAFYGFTFAPPTGGPATVELPIDFSPSS
jgi:outer membrane biosynthesis protein TonB